MKQLSSIFTSIEEKWTSKVSVQLNTESPIEINLMNFCANALAQNWTDEMIEIVRGFCIEYPNAALGALQSLVLKTDDEVRDIIKRFDREYPYIHGLDETIVQNFLTEYFGADNVLLTYLQDYVLSKGLCEVTL